MPSTSNEARERLAKLEEWAEVLAIAAGPWNQDEMRSLAYEILETVAVDVADSALRLARQEVREALDASQGLGTVALMSAARRVGRLDPEVVITEATQNAVLVPSHPPPSEESHAVESEPGG